jgi:hypothetical protein
MQGNKTALLANELLGLNTFLTAGFTKWHHGPCYQTLSRMP